MRSSKTGDLLVIGIAGGTGSGKSTITRALTALLGPAQVTVLALDDYYKRQEHLSVKERAATNYDHPDAFDFELLLGHLDDLREGRPIEIPQYDFSTHTRKATAVRMEAAPITILEGILALHAPELRSRMDLKVFVEAPDQVRLARRIERDTNERGRTREQVLRQHDQTLGPMHERYVKPQKRFADLVVRGTTDVSESVSAIERELERRDAR